MLSHTFFSSSLSINISILLFIIYSSKTNFSISENKIYHSIIITTIITGLIEIYSFILVKNNIAVDSSLYLYTLKLLFNINIVQK